LRTTTESPVLTSLIVYPIQFTNVGQMPQPRPT
jgi:hypothetical protein